METTNLKISTSYNRALNQDGVTLLRSLQFVQTETYQVNLAFLESSTPVVPAIDAFSFSLRNAAGVDIIVVNSVTAQSGDYPYYFTIALDAPALTALLGGALFVDMQGVLTYEAAGQLEAVQPFPIRVFNTNSAGQVNSFVSSLNGLANAVSIVGGGSVSVEKSGQQITVFGAAPTGDYYLNSNPSGFITEDALWPYALQSSLDATGNALAGSVAALAAQTGTYAQQSALAHYVSLTGTQTIGGNKTFAYNVTLGFMSFPNGGGFNNSYFYDGNGDSSLDILSRTLSTENGTTLDWNHKTLSDGWNLGDATGNLYPSSNPSGYINNSALAHTVATTGDQTISGNKTFADSVGLHAMTFPIGGFSNTYFYDTDGNSTVDIVNKTLGNSIGTVLNWNDLHLFGNWNLGLATGSLYPAYNPSGFAPTGYVNSVVAATGNTILSQVNNLNNHTGDYYPKTNPSGFATTGYVNAQILADDVRTLPGRSIHGMAMVNGCSSAAYTQFPDLILPAGSYNIVFYPTKISITLSDVVPTSDVTITVGEQGFGSTNLFSVTLTSAAFVGGENRTIIIDPFEQGYFDEGVRTNGFTYSGGVISDIFLQVYPDTSNPFHSFVVYVEGFYGTAYNLQDSSVALGSCSAGSGGGSSGGGGGF